MHKELFDDAIGEVPPSTVDVDAAIVRGRRAAVVRRVVNPVVAAGVVVVLLIGVVAYTMTRPGPDDIGTPGGPPSSTSQSDDPSSDAPSSDDPSSGVPSADPSV